MMKRAGLAVFLCALCLMAAGCGQQGQPSEAGSQVMQEMADRSDAAKAFCEPLFAAHMAEQNMTYTVERTSYGFYTADTADSVCLVGFLYTANGQSGMYGYKVSVDADRNCRVVAEGVDVAEFLFRNGDADT